MPNQLPPCPECQSDMTYGNGEMLACPMCGHEWFANADGQDDSSSEAVVRDAVGNILEDGDTVTIVKDLKIKGSGGGTIKVGTKVTNIRLTDDGLGDHDIDARVPGFGPMGLKSSVVKKLV